jgi:hypothetical protein
MPHQNTLHLNYIHKYINAVQKINHRCSENHMKIFLMLELIYGYIYLPLRFQQLRSTKSEISQTIRFAETQLPLLLFTKNRQITKSCAT